MQVAELIISKLIMLPGILLAISMFGLSESFVAHKLGDDTAKQAGRMSLDPLKHLDPMGLMLLILIGFGWSKPIPVDYNNIKNRKKGALYLTLAGSVANILLSILLSIFLFTGMKYNVNEIILVVIKSAQIICLHLALFNLIPLPPLNGYLLLTSLLPYKQREKLYAYESYLNFALIALIIFNGVSFILRPIISFMDTYVYNIIYNIIMSI